MITIANKRKFYGDGIYVSRPSPLGNPFPLAQESDRDFVIAEYREWLANKMETDTPQRKLLLKLAALAKTEDLTLICWCAPKKCHASVIKEFIEKINHE